MNDVNTIASFRIDKTFWSKFKAENKNASAKLKQLMENSLNNGSDTKLIQRDNITGLIKMINEAPALNLSGNTGVGKTTMIKNLIKNDSSHVFIIIDSHSEYLDLGLPAITSITPEVLQSSRVVLPTQSSGAKGLMSVYTQQLLSTKFPDTHILIVEESHRYKIAELMKESRKYIKVIAVSPERVYNFCDSVKVIQ